MSKTSKPSSWNLRGVAPSKGSRPRRSHLPLDPASLAAIQMPFGKYASVTLERIYELEPDYLRWVARAGRGRTAHDGLKRIAPAVENFLRTLPERAA